MATQREKDVVDYLEKHKIFELMENLTSMLFFYRPENPREFLIEQLEQLKMSQQNGVDGPNLFNNSNLDAVFGILDPANKKYITFAQYKHGFKACRDAQQHTNNCELMFDVFFHSADMLFNAWYSVDMYLEVFIGLGIML
ncbi:EF-hand calcium-binding domain-containing protein 10 isoform X1 [Etheostoma spectabile]|uniref:EF-hand calcium-binding domain-containing protein 10 isoform X1 n=1 Tax=Etheostoma spectabile TaxID=54343 RepID=UPI0013AE9167|nr:EF-hand calcium-binding domain-containing protein 10 isoform X1 [Etheostoma spectabile]